MTKFTSLLICALVALVAEVASTSNSATIVAMNQCTCTCPSKTDYEASAPMATNSRKRRQAVDGDEDYDMQNTEDIMENSSKKDEQGDTIRGSNNGGNQKYQLGEGSSDGNNNVISRGSYGHTGRKIGKVKAKGSIKFGG